jgi:hypothetical protein
MSSVKSNNANIYKEMCKRLLKKGHFRTIRPSDFRTIGPSPYQVHLALAGLELTMLVVIATDYLGSCQSIYHTIMTMTAPYINIRQPLLLYVVVSTEVDTFCLYICIAD